MTLTWWCLLLGVQSIAVVPAPLAENLACPKSMRDEAICKGRGYAAATTALTLLSGLRVLGILRGVPIHPEVLRSVRTYIATCLQAVVGSHHHSYSSFDAEDGLFAGHQNAVDVLFACPPLISQHSCLVALFSSFCLQHRAVLRKAKPLLQPVLERCCILLPLGADVCFMDGIWRNSLNVSETWCRVVLLAGARIGRRTRHLCDLRVRNVNFERMSSAPGYGFLLLTISFDTSKGEGQFWQTVSVPSEVGSESLLLGSKYFVPRVPFLVYGCLLRAVPSSLDFSPCCPAGLQGGHLGRSSRHRGRLCRPLAPLLVFHQRAIQQDMAGRADKPSCPTWSSGAASFGCAHVPL